MSRSLSWLALVLLLASPVPGQMVETTVVEVGAGQALVFADAARTPPAIGQVVAGQAYVRVASQGGMAKVLWSSKGPTHAWIEEQALTLAEGRKKYLVADTAAGFGVGWVVAPMGIDELPVGPDTDGTMIVAHAGSTLTVSTKSLLEAADAGPRVAAPTPSSKSPTSKTPARKRPRPVAPASDGSQPTPAVRSDTPLSDRPGETERPATRAPVGDAKNTRPRRVNDTGNTTPGEQPVERPVPPDESTRPRRVGDATEETPGKEPGKKPRSRPGKVVPTAGKLDLNRAVYPPYAPVTVALFEEAARVAGLPLEWARSEGLHRLLDAESDGWVGRPNYTYDTPSVKRSLADNRSYWPAIHAELKRGVKSTRSSASGLGQLLLDNVRRYYPGGVRGIGDPLSEAVGMLKYIKLHRKKGGAIKHGDPDRAWANYNLDHEGY